MWKYRLDLMKKQVFPGMTCFLYDFSSILETGVTVVGFAEDLLHYVLTDVCDVIIYSGRVKGERRL